MPISNRFESRELSIVPPPPPSGASWRMWLIFCSYGQIACVNENFLWVIGLVSGKENEVHVALANNYKCGIVGDHKAWLTVADAGEFGPRALGAVRSRSEGARAGRAVSRPAS